MKSIEFLEELIKEAEVRGKIDVLQAAKEGKVMAGKSFWEYNLELLRDLLKKDLEAEKVKE